MHVSRADLPALFPPDKSPFEAVIARNLAAVAS